MRISKQPIKATSTTEMMFVCPECHNQSLIDLDTEVYSILDIDHDDHFVCDECGSEFYGEVGYDMKPKFTKIKDVEAATNTCNIGAMPIIDADEDEKINAAISPRRRSETTKRIHDDVQNRAVKWFKEDYGDPDISLNDINSMLVVDETQADDGRTIVEVRAELSYDGMWELSEVLNKVIAKYDKEAYFDMEEPGIMTAYLDLDGIYSSKVINVKRVPVKASISPAQEAENDMNSTITAASYGGAFDIEDDQYFTRDDLNEFGYSVAELISLDLMADVEYAAAWIDNNQLTIQFVYDNDYEAEVNLKIDMRKIRRPSDLLAKYGDAVAQKVVADFKDQGVLDLDDAVESTTEITAYRDSWYEPNDDTAVEFEDVTDTIEINLDGTRFRLDADIRPEFDEATTEWADDNEIELEYDYYRLDPDQIIDDVWYLVSEAVPDAEGEYMLKGAVKLQYTLTNISGYKRNVAPSDDWAADDYEIAKDFIDVEFDIDGSEIVSLNVIQL